MGEVDRSAGQVGGMQVTVLMESASSKIEIVPRNLSTAAAAAVAVAAAHAAVRARTCEKSAHDEWIKLPTCLHT